MQVELDPDFTNDCLWIRDLTSLSHIVSFCEEGRSYYSGQFVRAKVKIK